MHFDLHHDFAAPPAAVADVWCDAAFHTALDLPDLSRPEVVTDALDGTTRILRLRYGYIGQLDPIARKIVGGRKLTWIQELRFDPTTFTGTLSFSAEEEPKKVNGLADVTITPVHGTITPVDGTAVAGGARRRIAGDFHIRIPVVGGTAEKKIVPGLVRRLDVEADAVRLRLDTPHPGHE